MITRRATIARFGWMTLGLVGMVGGGCASSGSGSAGSLPPPMLGSNQPDRPTPADTGYRVAAGDTLQIETPLGEAPQETTVRGDGSIHLASGATVRADGRTAREIADELAREVGGPYRNSQVSVKDYNSQYIQVFGTDKSDGPKIVPFRGKETLAQFFTRTGHQRSRQGYRVRVVRPGKTIGATPEIFAAQLDEDLVERPTGEPPIALQPGDYVYIAKDMGKPGAMTKMTEGRWYQKPGQWIRQMRGQTPEQKAMVRR